MEEVLLVSEMRLKEYGGLDENIRVEDITYNILSAQDLWIQPILGTKFYNRLKEGVRLDNLTSDENELLQDYVAKTLIFYSIYLMLPVIKYKIVQKGILNGASEETTPTNLEELKYLRQSTLDRSEFYQKRLLEFLKDYPGKFPEYEVYGTKGMSPDKTSPYFSGLVTKIPNRKIQDCNIIEGPSPLSNPQ